MKVVHVITGLADGGAEAILYRLCTTDSENQHVVISMMDDGKYGPQLRASGIAVHCLSMPRGRTTPRALALLFRLLRDQKPDVVQTWMYHADLVGGTVARLAGAPRVLWGVHHGSLDLRDTKLSTILVAKQCALLSRLVPSRIVSCSKEAVNVHTRAGYEPSRFVVIPNGYDVNRFKPDPELRASFRADWGVDGATPLVGMVARFNPGKDHANLFDALVLLARRGRRVQCLLVGDGVSYSNPKFAALVQAKRVHDHIRLLPAVPDIASIMTAIDIHVLSSSGEAFPNVVAEAMACGTPCVSTNVGDAAYIIGNTGWLAPPRNASALADALDAALAARDDHESWAERCRDARERIQQNFSVQRMCESYRSLWRRTIEHQSNST